MSIFLRVRAVNKVSKVVDLLFTALLQLIALRVDHLGQRVVIHLSRVTWPHLSRDTQVTWPTPVTWYTSHVVVVTDSLVVVLLAGFMKSHPKCSVTRQSWDHPTRLTRNVPKHDWVTALAASVYPIGRPDWCLYCFVVFSLKVFRNVYLTN